MKFVLNDLSYDNRISKIESEHDAKNCIDIFAELISQLSKNGIIKHKGDIVSVHDIMTIDFDVNFNLYKWSKCKSITKESRQLLKRNIDKYVKFYSCKMESEFIFTQSTLKCKSDILMYAVKNKFRAISFCSTEMFRKKHIKGLCVYICDGSIIEKEECISNVCDNSDIPSLCELLTETRYEHINSGYDLWENKDELFPNLVICESVKKQLYANPSMSHIKPILTKLEILDDYYVNSKYDKEHLRNIVSDESPSVKNDRYLKNLRKFKKPDNTYEYFFKHIRFSGDFSGRIHFFENNKDKQIYIGYIGKHLKTAKF